MAVLSKLRPFRKDQLPEAWRSIPPPPCPALPANVPDDWITSQWRTWDAPVSIVHGESHYHDALLAMTGPPRPNGYLVPVEVVLRREPTNPYDANAVRVEVQGRHVGYIARDLAGEVTNALTPCGGSCSFAGLLRGGYTGARDVGVMLWPDQRLSDAPSLDFGSVPYVEWKWPPGDDEGLA